MNFTQTNDENQQRPLSHFLSVNMRWLCNNSAVRAPMSFLITLSRPRSIFSLLPLAAINYSANAPTAAAIAESFKDLN